jgi:KipI family sensor histidine kinase inhibitor
VSAAVPADGGRIRAAGDAALLLELDPVIDAAVNARAIAVARHIRESRLAGVYDVVPTYRTVAVFFDPLVADVDAIATTLAAARNVPAQPAAGATIDVPVTYGGEAGPDLGEVAAWAGLPADAVIERHTRTTYRVFMLGFLPGFAYMGTVDDAIAAPRRATPRLRVPAGSVGIAGRQTGIYPRESPGGWQIVGRTALVPFDPFRSPPALLQPGDTVRFVRAPAPTTPAALPSPQPNRPSPDAASVVVLRPGLFTSIQDGGRRGYQSLGVSVAGPMDTLAHRLANQLAGNEPDAAALEATILGPELRLERDTTLALAGADLGATLDGTPLPMHAPHRGRAGSVIRFGERRSGARAYLAFDGGIATTPVLGSRATHAASGLGGLHGARLRAGDRFPLGPPHGAARAFVPGGSTRVVGGGARLRVLPGPQDDAFDAAAFDELWRSRFVVTPQSDRMGYRLAGARIARARTEEMISDATFAGSLQVPPSGEPILLMADRQTTGGYPQIATVISADLPLAGQLAPGDWVEFEPCSRAGALAALRSLEGVLRAVR